MALQENDVSWQVLRRIVHDWAGSAAELTEVKHLVGGCINTTLALFTKTGDRAVLKIAAHRVNPQFMREAMQLQLMRDVGVPAPQVYGWKIATLDEPHSYLLMEFIDGINLNHAKKQCAVEEFDELQRNLAEIVVKLHTHTGEKYLRAGGDEGAPRFDRWVDFYRHVYDPIWQDVAKDPVVPPKCRKQIGKIHERLDKLIQNEDCPRLVHWDIWGTNLLVASDEQGKWRIKAVLDPNCKYAHAEAEIAYMDLFHTITPAFLKEYQHTFKLAPAYHERRKLVYQMYPLLNHVHLFGHAYVKPLMAMVDKVSAVV